MNCYNRIHLASAVTDAAWFLDTPMTAWVWILGPMKAVTVTFRTFMPARYKPFITCASCATVIRLQLNCFFNLTHNYKLFDVINTPSSHTT